jgi:hypothetical protein
MGTAACENTRFNCSRVGGGVTAAVAAEEEEEDSVLVVVVESTALVLFCRNNKAQTALLLRINAAREDIMVSVGKGRETPEMEYCFDRSFLFAVLRLLGACHASLFLSVALVIAGRGSRPGGFLGGCSVSTLGPVRASALFTTRSSAAAAAPPCHICTAPSAWLCIVSHPPQMGSCLRLGER